MLESSFENSMFVTSTIGLALLFDFMNGFHDAANSIATVVSTRVLRPHWAVIWAAFFNAIAFIFFSHHVAETIGKEIIDPQLVDVSIIFSALVGAILWNGLTWYYGLPASSSHALIGALGGAMYVKAGHTALNATGFLKIGISIVLSPLCGLVLSGMLMFFMSYAFRKSTPKKVDRWSRKLQLISAALYSLGHGGNDAQKTMGIIAILLCTAHHQAISEFSIPYWVALSCQLAMGLGTLMGGWRIVRTMGLRITQLKPLGGFCAETAGSITLFLATQLGIPISTTHTIAGAILGIGTVTKLSTVRWQIAKKIGLAWIITVPASGGMAMICWYLLQWFL